MEVCVVRVTKDVLEWVDANHRLISDIRKAREFLQYGQVVIQFVKGEYAGMEVHKKYRISQDVALDTSTH